MARKKQFKYKKYFYRMKLHAGDTQETAEETQETGDQETGDGSKPLKKGDFSNYLKGKQRENQCSK